MSIRDGLLRNRRVYERTLGRREPQPGQFHLPESSPPDIGFQPQIPPETFLLAPALSQEPEGNEQAGAFSLTSSPPSGPEEAADFLLRAIEREGRFVSQNLQGEE